MTNKLLKGMVTVFTFAITLPAAATEWAPQPNANIITTWKEMPSDSMKLMWKTLPGDKITITPAKKSKEECLELELAAIADTMNIRPARMLKVRLRDLMV